MQYSIRLDIDNSEKETLLYFRDADEKRDYVEKEYAFCSKEYLAWSRSNKWDKPDARKKLASKRKAFARSKGFAPKKEDKYTWIYSPNFNRVSA